MEKTKHKSVAPLVDISDFAIRGIPAEGLFMPGFDSDSTELLLESLWRRRQASFLAGALTILQACPDLANETGFTNTVETFHKAPLVDRRAMMEHPCARIWLGRMCQLPRLDCLDTKDQAALRNLLIDGTRVLRISPETNFAVQRFDVDPLLAATVPPSYSFDELDAKRRRETRNPYSLVFAKEVVATALYRIGEVWPAVRSDFDRFVKIVIHLPDMESRSCSAARFAGAILLSSSDDTLLAVEESLVHEFGHQVLYCVMELEPLIHDNGKRSFTLPWSGSQRDAYGYFHAVYIYLILALFFERVVDSERDDWQHALSRLTDILAGLSQALDDFTDADFFTDAGNVFFERLANHAYKVIERNNYRCT